jgi:hypothetical protein
MKWGKNDGNLCDSVVITCLNFNEKDSSFESRLSWLCLLFWSWDLCIIFPSVAAAKIWVFLEAFGLPSLGFCCRLISSSRSVSAASEFPCWFFPPAVRVCLRKASFSFFPRLSFSSPAHQRTPCQTRSFFLNFLFTVADPTCVIFVFSSHGREPRLDPTFSLESAGQVPLPHSASAFILLRRFLLVPQQRTHWFLLCVRAGLLYKFIAESLYLPFLRARTEFLQPLDSRLGRRGLRFMRPWSILSPRFRSQHCWLPCRACRWSDSFSNAFVRAHSAPSSVPARFVFFLSLDSILLELCCDSSFLGEVGIVHTRQIKSSCFSGSRCTLIMASSSGM